MRVMVTGAGGFVGRHLVAHLAAGGHEVIGTTFDGAADGGGEGLPQEVRLVPLDVEEPAAVHRVMEAEVPQAVVHLAGLSDVAASWTAMDRYFRVNVLGTENLLRAAGSECRVVFASSAEVYGKVEAAQLPLTEQAPLRPSTPYAMTKASAERLAVEAGAVVARSFNLIGPGQSPRFALPSFAEQLASIARGESEAVLRVGNLTARRDFVHITDGVRAYQALLENGESGAVYNVASGEATEIHRALELLLDASGLEVRLEQDPDRMRPSDVPVICGDPTRLQALGWHAEKTVQDAVVALWRSVETPSR